MVASWTDDHVYTDRAAATVNWVAQWVRRPAVDAKPNRVVEAAARAIIRPRDVALVRQEVSEGIVAIEEIVIGAIVVIAEVDAIEVIEVVIGVVTEAIGVIEGIAIVETEVTVTDAIEGRSNVVDMFLIFISSDKIHF